MLKLGCCTYNFRAWDLEESFRFISNLGFKYASVGAYGPNAQVNLIDAAGEPGKAGRKVRELAVRYGLELPELFMCSIYVNENTRVSPSHPDAALRRAMLERFRKICLFALEAGIKNVMGVPGDLWSEEGPGDEWSIAADTLKEMVGIAAETGAGFSVEPHKGSIITGIDSAWKLLEEVPGLRYSVDYGQMTGMNVPLEDIIKLNGHSVNIHLKPSKPGFTKCLMHEGTLDYALIMNDLMDRNWPGVACIECIYDTNSDSFTGHPAFQNVLLTYEIERIIGSDMIERR